MVPKIRLLAGHEPPALGAGRPGARRWAQRHPGRLHGATAIAARWLVLALALALLPACGSPPSAAPPDGRPSPEPSPAVFFPRQKPPINGYLTALLSGRLVADEGCLRVSSNKTRKSFLVVWLPDLRPSTAGGAIRVLDARGRVVARVGQRVSFGGGAIEGARVPDDHTRFIEGLPARCRGPWWILGEIG